MHHVGVRRRPGTTAGAHVHAQGALGWEGVASACEDALATALESVLQKIKVDGRRLVKEHLILSLACGRPDGRRLMMTSLTLLHSGQHFHRGRSLHSCWPVPSVWETGSPHCHALQR